MRSLFFKNAKNLIGSIGKSSWKKLLLPYLYSCSKFHFFIGLVLYSTAVHLKKGIFSEYLNLKNKENLGTILL